MSATADLMALLKRHYIKPGLPLPGGIFLPEVGWNPAGGLSGRDGGCDAIYVGFTSSSGRVLVGHELKVSRSDWLNELNKPGKADAWADQCHQWWLVVSDPAIVHEGELPHGWGLMSPGKSKTRMTVHVKAEHKGRDHQPSWLAVRSIMARQDTLRAEAINRARSDAHHEATADVDERVKERIKLELTRNEHNDGTIRELRAQLRSVENALGVNLVWKDKPAGFLNQATVDEIAEVRAVLAETRSVKAAVRKLCGVANGYQIDNLQRAIDTMRGALAGLDEASAPAAPPVPQPLHPTPPKPAAPPAITAVAQPQQPDLLSEVFHA
ncbi:hypothetical protein [Mycolicibacterium mucogenicum]|uniref:hypothetical protein n=1 Tax=Mycolicibacterium mucogenicum TaxID=56689 RepID=UPI000A45C026|nr:hypothetical protein [Mycolicibacterium mucogenicum]